MERLPRLPQGVGLVTPSGKPTQAFQRWWQHVVEQLESARSTMGDLPNLTFQADYQGTISSGLPANVAAKRYFGETDVTTSSAWSFSVTDGSVTATIGASTGVLNITAVGAASSTVKITSVFDGQTLSRTFTITRQDAGTPPSGGGGGGSGGSSSSDSTFSSINAATHAAISDELTVTAGSAGEVDLTANLTVHTAEVAPAGTFEVYGIWKQWDGVSTYNDVGTEVASSPDSTVVTDTIDPDTGTVTYLNSPKGTLSVIPATITGLTPSSSYKFQLYARNSSGTRTMSFSGTASAVGS